MSPSLYPLPLLGCTSVGVLGSLRGQAVPFPQLGTQVIRYITHNIKLYKKHPRILTHIGTVGHGVRKDEFNFKF